MTKRWPKPIKLKGKGLLSDQVLRDRGYYDYEIAASKGEPPPGLQVTVVLTPKSALALAELKVRMGLGESDLVNRLLIAAQEMPMFPWDLGLQGGSRRWDP